jgi:hypothetical protein
MRRVQGGKEAIAPDYRRDRPTLRNEISDARPHKNIRPTPKNRTFGDKALDKSETPITELHALYRKELGNTADRGEAMENAMEQFLGHKGYSEGFRNELIGYREQSGIDRMFFAAVALLTERQGPLSEAAGRLVNDLIPKISDEAAARYITYDGTMQMLSGNNEPRMDRCAALLAKMCDKLKDYNKAMVESTRNTVANLLENGDALQRKAAGIFLSKIHTEVIDAA